MPRATSIWGAKSQVQLAIENPRQVKQAAADRLQKIAALTPSTDIDKAAGNIKAALEPGLWRDGYHLDAQQGHKEFDQEKQVVKDIMKLLKDKKISLPAETKTGLQAISDDTIFSDRALIIAALSEAEGRTARTPEFIKKQETELTKARAGLKQAEQETDIEKKIDAFKKAWETSELAIEFAAK